MLTGSQLVLAFLAYSFLGWLVEGLVLLGCNRRLANPGFLAGPVVPIYGVGALGVLICTASIQDRPILVFAVGVAVTTVVEFLGHLLLQRLLGLVLWDYTGRLGSIQGRVCLVNSLGFGIAALAVVYLIDPLLRDLLAGLAPLPTVALASALGAVFMVDWCQSTVSVLRLQPEIQAIQGSLTRVRAQVDRQLASLGSSFDQVWARRRIRLLQRSRKALTRLEAAFPQARTTLSQRSRRATPSVGLPARRTGGEAEPAVTDPGRDREPSAGRKGIV